MRDDDLFDGASHGAGPERASRISVEHTDLGLCRSITQCCEISRRTVDDGQGCSGGYGPYDAPVRVDSLDLGAGTREEIGDYEICVMRCVGTRA